MDESTPTAGGGSSSSSSVEVNKSYLKTANGIFSTLELVFGILCWALVAAVSSKNDAAYGFVLFVSISSWISTLITFGIFVTSLNKVMCSNAPWAIILFLENSAWSLLYLIASCVSAAFVMTAGSFVGRTTLRAASAFGFFSTFAYVGHAIFGYRDWKSSSPAASVSA